MIPAADVMPPSPNGVKSDRLSELQPCTPSTTNSTSTPILIITITALTFADSLAPRISSSVQSPTRTTAGRLKMPPASGACDNDVGDREAEQVVQQLVEVLRPADRDGRRGHAVLEQQAGGDDHRHALARASRTRTSTTSPTPAPRSPARRNRSRSARRPRRRARRTRSPPARRPGTACVSTMKMPVPIVAPMPNIDSWKSPIERDSSPDPVSVPASAVISATAYAAGPAPAGGCFTASMSLLSRGTALLQTSRASRSSQVSRRTTARASPAPAKTTGMRRLPL